MSNIKKKKLFLIIPLMVLACYAFSLSAYAAIASKFHGDYWVTGSSPISSYITIKAEVTDCYFNNINCCDSNNDIGYFRGIPSSINLGTQNNGGYNSSAYFAKYTQLTGFGYTYASMTDGYMFFSIDSTASPKKITVKGYENGVLKTYEYKK